MGLVGILLDQPLADVAAQQMSFVLLPQLLVCTLEHHLDVAHPPLLYLDLALNLFQLFLLLLVFFEDVFQSDLLG